MENTEGSPSKKSAIAQTTIALFFHIKQPSTLHQKLLRFATHPHKVNAIAQCRNI
jgi:hypothetical protein